MLLTCPIKGGNSGGPIINELGEVVGVITDLPYSEGNQSMYDNFGYGCATPIEYIDDLIKR
jgi:S1-C subfamily serine protease